MEDIFWLLADFFSLNVTICDWMQTESEICEKINKCIDCLKLDVDFDIVDKKIGEPLQLIIDLDSYLLRGNYIFSRLN